MSVNKNEMLVESSKEINQNIKIKHFNYGMELLRILACISIVVIHVSDKIVLNNHLFGSLIWNMADLMEGLCRFAVPVFLMISGANIIGKENKKVLKALFKLIYVYIFWSIAYIIFNSYIFGINLNLKMLVDLKTFSASYQLWYFKAAILAYLGMIVLNFSEFEKSKKSLEIIIAIWFAIIFIAYFAKFALNSQLINYSILTGNIVSFFAYTGWCVLGYYLKNNFNKVNPLLCLSVFFIGVLITAYFRVSFFKLNPYTWNEYPYSNFSVNLLLMSTSLFLLFINLKINTLRMKKIIKFLGTLTFGIFLIHPMFISIFNIIYKYNTSISYYVIEMISVVFISMIFAGAIKQIPILKKII